MADFSSYQINRLTEAKSWLHDAATEDNLGRTNGLRLLQDIEKNLSEIGMLDNEKAYKAMGTTKEEFLDLKSSSYVLAAQRAFDNAKNHPGTSYAKTELQNVLDYMGKIHKDDFDVIERGLKKSEVKEMMEAKSSTDLSFNTAAPAPVTWKA